MGFFETPVPFILETVTGPAEGVHQTMKKLACTIDTNGAPIIRGTLGQLLPKHVQQTSLALRPSH